MFQVMLAHGLSGNNSWDDEIFLGIVLLFIIMMSVGWVQSQKMEPRRSKSETADPPPAAESPPEDAD